MRSGTNHPTYQVKVDAVGRVVLPAEARQPFGIRQGEDLILADVGQGLRLKTVRQAVEEAQAPFSALAPVGVCLSAEFSRERREETARE